MRKLVIALFAIVPLIGTSMADAGWRDRDRRGPGWDRRGPSCDVIRQVCRNRHGFGYDYRRCVRARGCQTWGF